MVWNSMVQTLVNGISLFFTSPNARIQKTNYRTYVVLNVGTAVGIALHVTMMSVFAALGAVDLVRFNVVSIAAFVLAMCFNRRGWHLASVLTSVLELTVHQALCMTYLGWATGFQYFLVIPTITNFLPEGRNAIKAPLGAALGAGLRRSCSREPQGVSCLSLASRDQPADSRRERRRRGGYAWTLCILF